MIDYILTYNLIKTHDPLVEDHCLMVDSINVGQTSSGKNKQSQTQRQTVSYGSHPDR